MTRWQYQVVDLGTLSMAKHMADSFGRLGQQGWELVTVTMQSDANLVVKGAHGYAIFKRPVPEGAEPDGEWGASDYHAGAGRDDTPPEGGTKGEYW